MPAIIPDTDPSISDITVTRDADTGRVTVSFSADAASVIADLLDGLDLSDYAQNPGYFGLADQDGADQSAAGAALLARLLAR